MLTSEVKDSLKGLGKAEITAKISSGEIDLPVKGSQEREEFMKFAMMETEERDKALSEEVPTDDGPQDNEPTNPPQPEEDSKDVQPENTKSWWETEGFKSEDEAIENVKQTREANAALQNTLDQLNAKEGKRGQQIKALRDEKTQLEQSLEELQKKVQPKIEEPEKPTRPKVSDYEDGQFSNEYKEDLDKYSEQLEDYFESLTEYKISKKAEEIESKVTNIRKDFEKKISTATSNGVDPLEDLFKKDVAQFQKDFGLEMSVDAWTVNQSVLGLQSSDPEVKARAEQFVNTFPPADKAKWSKIIKAVNTTYTIADGVPEARYKTIEGALYDNGLLGTEFSKPSQQTESTANAEAEMREKKKQELNNSVAVPSVSDTESHDTLAGDELTGDELKKRYRDLLTKFKTVINTNDQKAYEASPEFSEMMRLRQKLGMQPPSYMR